MSPGGTTGTPITGGAGTGLLVAQALQATQLSLDRYARIVGVVAPPHFFGSYSPTVFPLKGQCDVVVPRHGWQLPEVVSREEILEQVYIAEQELFEYLGYHVGPTFVENETHPYPKPYDPLYTSSGGLATDNMEKSISPRDRFMIQPGIRALTLIGTATTVGSSLDYTDEDGDGFVETALVTFPTTETEICELKCYVPGTAGAAAWEIRYPKKKYFDGTGNVVFEFYVWQFVSPDIDARFPTVNEYRALDITDTSNLLDSVDIYREYVDNTQASARFYWESDPNCVTPGSTVDAGSLLYQDGVAIIREVQSGLLVPRAATYDASTGIWTGDAWTVKRDPDIARVSYYAGDVSQAYLNGVTCDPLKDVYAKAIAYMATARLSRSICSCANVVQFFESLQKDLAHQTSGDSFAIGFKELANPFGTRRGELMAWNLIGKLRRERAEDVAVI
jgi:hypothetical protein